MIGIALGQARNRQHHQQVGRIEVGIPGRLAADVSPKAHVALEQRRHDRLDAISECLQLAGKNVSYAAKQLRVSRMTLYRLMAKHRISA